MSNKIEPAVSSASDPHSGENKMGYLPVNRLLISMSLPIMISMLVQALYNIVDSIFVGRLSENALTSVSMAFPIQTLMIAVSTGTAVGINANLSRYLGQKRFQDADRVAVNGIFLAVISSLCFAVFGLFCSGFYFSKQINDAQIVSYGTDYLTIVTACSIGLFMQITMERLLQSTGKTLYTMITQCTGAVINIILDPIMIFGLLGFPRLEVAGAAIATVTGQIIAGLFSIYFNKKVNKEINLSMRGFRPSGSVIGQIYRIGIPSIIMQSITSVMTFLFNNILLIYSATAVSVLGVYFKLQSFVFMPIFGLNNGMIPIVAYNYGAQHKKRIRSTFRLAVIIAMSIMAIGFLAFQFFPKELICLFNDSPDMISIGVPALRIISTSFIPAGFAIVCSCLFQALGNAVYSLIISLARQLFVIIPVAYLFSELFGLHSVWFSFPIAEVVSILMSILFLRRIYRLKISKIPE